jgi:hypothetical protein
LLLELRSAEGPRTKALIALTAASAGVCRVPKIFSITQPLNFAGILLIPTLPGFFVLDDYALAELRKSTIHLHLQ